MAELTILFDRQAKENEETFYAYEVRIVDNGELEYREVFETKAQAIKDAKRLTLDSSVVWDGKVHSN